MSLKLFHDSLSQPCRALYTFFKTAGIPYEDVWVALRKNEHKTPEFLAINPFAKVPVLIDETTETKVIVKESCAIARYVASKYLPPSSHWWPMDDTLKSTRIDEYLHWQHLNLRAHGSLVFINAVLQPMLTKKPPKMEKVLRSNKELDKCADLFQTHFLDNGKFITGDEISVADLFAIAEINQPWMAGFDVSASRPRLAAWIEDVKSETEPHYYQSNTYVRQVHETFSEGIQEAYKEFLVNNHPSVDRTTGVAFPGMK